MQQVTQIDNLNQTLSERDGQIDAYRVQAEQLDLQLSAASTQIVNFMQAIKQRDEHITNLNQTLTIRDHEIAALRSSTSWRITRPLRNVSRLLNRSRKTANPGSTLELYRLPEDFDPDMYLKLNPDLAEAAVDPSTHYLSHGHQEGRAFSLPTLDLCGDHEFKPSARPYW